ncbi:MAG: dTDP-4-dehydrorhamnose reductase [Selenomonadaceae bacterium]|nr:dTDP-4-dehydrorhamnose reductase [Selenomonadaceae bacterium]
MILITGILGQLGYDLAKEFTKRGVEYIAPSLEELELTTEAGAKNFILDKKPEMVVHCAAYTAVDKAETEQELALTVNGLGTRWVAEACREIGAKMIYISTDYVFGGDGKTPYEVNDEKKPVNVYGRSKLLGEDAVNALVEKHFIVRTSWVFGINGNNFIKTMLKLGETKKKLNVVNDQIGSPTYTPDLAKLLADMAASDKYGTYHATNEGFCSWADFAREIFEQAGLDVEVDGIPTIEYPTPAKRPFNSRLSKKSLDEAGFDRLPPWQDALKRYLVELKNS